MRTMLLDEEDEVSTRSRASPCDAKFFLRLDTTLGKTPKDTFSPTRDDENGCAAHTDEQQIFKGSFFNDTTPLSSPRIVENNNSAANQKRYSHELALSPRRAARESLVDHMLLSFDQLKTNHFAPNQAIKKTVGRDFFEVEENIHRAFDDNDSYQSINIPTSHDVRGMKNKTSYIYDAEDFNEVGIYSDQKPNLHQRSSESQFKTSSDMIVEQKLDPLVGYQRLLAQRKSKRSKSHSGSRENKNKSYTDFDYFEPISYQKWARNQSSRSSSFDYKSGFNDARDFNVRGDWNTKYESYQYHIEPNPTRHYSSERDRDASPARTPYSESTSFQKIYPKLETKISIKSMKNTVGQRLPERSDSIATFTASTGPKESFERIENLNQSRKLTHTPGSNKKRQPSHAKLKKESPPSTNAPLPTLPVNLSIQSKDRPGFFRRVFGSSKNHVRNNIHGVNLDNSPPHGSSSSIETVDLPITNPQPIDVKRNSEAQNREEIVSVSHPSPSIPKNLMPRRSSTTTAPEELMPNVDRKPSSFFRRRKKSYSSKATNALANSQTRKAPNDEISFDKVLPTPPTSLPSVLHPYLQTLNPSIDIFSSQDLEDQHDKNNQDTGNDALTSFSPSYDPIPSAKIRPVKECVEETHQNLGLSSILAQQLLKSSNRSRSPTAVFKDSGTNQNSMFYQENNANRGDTSEFNSSYVNHLATHPIGDKSPAYMDRKYVPVSIPTYKNFESSDDGEYAWSRSHPLIPRQQMTESASSIKRTHIARQHSEDWVKISGSKTLTAIEKDDRVWLEPSSDEEESLSSQAGTAESVLLSVQRARSDSKASIDGSIGSITESFEDKKFKLDRPFKNEFTPTVSSDSNINIVYENKISDKNVKDYEIAREIFDGNENSVPKDKAADWLGKEDISFKKILEFYFDLYNFKHLNVLAALRKLCGRLVLKAESQKIDRILLAFSSRWCECNPHHGFKEIDVVYTIAYSLLLLNTDLHVANIEQKMSRSQFIKNTLPTIRKIIIHTFPHNSESTRPTILPGKCVAFENTLDNQEVKIDELLGTEKTSWKSYVKTTAPKSGTDLVSLTSHENENSIDDPGPLVEAPFYGTLRSWEVKLEMILKTSYNSIRNDPLPLYSQHLEKSAVLDPQSKNNLSGTNNNPLRRTPSILSHTPSDTQSYRSRVADSFLRVGNGKRMNKIRSRPRLYTAGSGIGSSRTSLDDQSSIMSPVSSTWSKYSLGKTQTSVSIDSMGSTWPNEKFQQSIGFANAISQAIIREEMVGSPGNMFHELDDINQTPLLEDDSLELHGAPWAKEGLVRHKHHLESLDKRARERNWTEVFAVIEKGYLSLFTFPNKSRRQKTKDKNSPGVVGGGNWQENAQNLGSFLLQQTIASALPSPGYSKARPHVWALSLPTGAVHLFQVGTPDVVQEFVSTANYWGARLSNHPLVGGISNIEYGWSDAIINMFDNKSQLCAKDAPKRPTTSSRNRPSISGQNNGPNIGRLSLDLGTSGVPRPRIFDEKIMISEWTPPTQNMRASNLPEQEQLSALTAYVSGIEEELQEHNKLRGPMLLAFCPRQPNAQKAMANWEKKSAYLLREIVKFTTYIDSLQAALTCKRKIYEEREQKLTENEPVIQELSHSDILMTSNE
ncbi:hypothetical protein HI914_06867 [Erysiphe necator]|nr:hypothetical protein HI914_06867 [Erysiphe necator]